MTAKVVNGKTALADEAAESPYLYDRKTGEKVRWRQVRRLLLEDGTITYGCAHCDYTSDNLNSIRPHLGKHNKKANQPGAPNGIAALPPNDYFIRLLRQVEQLDHVCAERDQWKARAQSAERDLATLRRVVNRS